ncbi:MAG: proline--tRNA ligase [Thaumarchaeota archaeon]|jgi:prolyl-tRNA synthetase|nr:proline--tRNA ligase [Nitrososphaerota archaeon]MBT4675345.1 proline--tRNA ligase [Nitrososphaerota archaeon]MBT5993829.1 proline--tRNA ligase [Nitrososphaerota archaeon]MBT6171154.1 proline--tRNA ligase [Nitrososphaerota archaeon]MBT6370608.1 proline--tRNA ligase [Nitrososphaerota archaeon]
MGKEIGITVKKTDDFSEWYTQTVIKSELVDYAPVKGLIVLRPDGYSIWESIKSSLDKKFAATGHRNGFLPTLIPESLLTKEKDHFAGFNPEVFWVTKSGEGELGDRLALRPTSETLAYTLFSKWIRSWRDLPLKINFWNTALRAEIKATKPFLRTSEFLWQEGHTVHTNSDEAQKEVTDILELYKKTVEEELAIPVITGKKSEKEKFVGAVYTFTMESLMPDGKALQMGTSHFLGQNFSKPFEVKYADKENVKNYAWQTSWGVSWRLIGGMIMVHGDDKGLVLPPRVAPIQVIIIPIYYSDEDKEKIQKISKEIENKLQDAKIRVQVDNREQLTPGFKFNDWEMKGIPLRIEIGPKELEKNQVTFARRHNRQKDDQQITGLVERVVSELDKIHDDMFLDAKKILEDRTVEVNTYDDFKKELEKGRLIKAPICDNPECEEKIKEETSADVRVITEDANDTNSKCIKCSNQSVIKPLFARGY